MMIKYLSRRGATLSSDVRLPGDLNIAGERHLQLQLRLRDALLRPDDRLR